MHSAPPTRAQVLGVIEATMAIGDAIRELGQVPSGELYARLMPAGIDLGSFEAIIGVLTKAGVVKQSNYLLTWIRPEKPTEVEK